MTTARDRCHHLHPPAATRHPATAPRSGRCRPAVAVGEHRVIGRVPVHPDLAGRRRTAADADRAREHRRGPIDEDRPRSGLSHAAVRAPCPCAVCVRALREQVRIDLGGLAPRAIASSDPRRPGESRTICSQTTTPSCSRPTFATGWVTSSIARVQGVDRVALDVLAGERCPLAAGSCCHILGRSGAWNGHRSEPHHRPDRECSSARPDSATRRAPTPSNTVHRYPAWSWIPHQAPRHRN